MFMLQFAHIFGEETLLSTTDFNVLLTFLSRDRNIMLYDGKVGTERGLVISNVQTC